MIWVARTQYPPEMADLDARAAELAARMAEDRLQDTVEFGPVSIDWHIYTGSALHEQGVDPVVVKLTPALVDQLEQCNHTAWEALLRYVIDCRTLDDST